MLRSFARADARALGGRLPGFALRAPRGLAAHGELFKGARVKGGWRELIKNWNWTRGEGRYPIAAYSEFMPAPWIGEKPYGARPLPQVFSDDEPASWRISEREQTQELAPGFASIGKQIIETLVALSAGTGPHKLGRAHLEGNPYWPSGLRDAPKML